MKDWKYFSARFMQGCMKLRQIKLLRGKFLFLPISFLFLPVIMSNIETSSLYPSYVNIKSELMRYLID